MAGDYSRIRFDAKRHYSGVLQKQGGLEIDAERNENVQLQERRWRAETIDVIGRTGVPQETPDGLKIENNGGALTIGEGRIYVDGHLAENHGIAPWRFSPVMEEERGSAPTPLDQQPYSQDAFVQPAAGRTLVYLDVWRRELTHLQQPDLIEAAVDIDTSARYQTAWRVRLLENVGDAVDCQTPLDTIPGWPAENLPSGARLSSDTTPVDPQINPCKIPPSGGYRGLSNQLYRVEVHAVNGNETLVKWSRENASVGSAMLKVSNARRTVRMESLGRDDVLGFHTGDWVEFTNDRRELAGLAGDIRRVTVDHSNNTLTFATALDVEFAVGSSPAEQHWRAIRWDQNGSVLRPDGTELTLLNNASDGLIHLTPADNAVILENGVMITLDLVGGNNANVGDHWCIAARTADADIEHLPQAPPLALHHHYCHLGYVESDGNVFVGEVEDCRPVFPPLTAINPGCCTRVVRPGEDIQAALDSLPPEGGCVCLKTGDHFIGEPIRIAVSNVVLHGESPGTRVIRREGVKMLWIEGNDFAQLNRVHVGSIRFIVLSGAAIDPTWMVRLRRVDDCVLEHCAFSLPEVAVHSCFFVLACERLRIQHCRVANFTRGLWVQADSTRLALLDNQWLALGDFHDMGEIAIFLKDAFGPSRIERNHIEGFLMGVILNSYTDDQAFFSKANGSVINDNSIRRRNRDEPNPDRKWFAIESAARNCTISNNVLSYGASYHGGIRAAADFNRVTANNLHAASSADSSSRLPLAIQHGLIAEEDADPPKMIRGGVINDNSLNGLQHGVLISSSSDIELRANRINSGNGDTANLATAILLDNSERVEVQDNSIQNSLFAFFAFESDLLELVENSISQCSIAIGLTRHTDVRINANCISTIEDFGLLSLESGGHFSFSENRVNNCCYENASLAAAFLMFVHAGDIRIEGNDIEDTGIALDGTAAGVPTGALYLGFVRDCLIQSNRIGFSEVDNLDLTLEHRALYLLGYLQFQDRPGPVIPGLSQQVQILDNRFVGPGASALIEIQRLNITNLSGSGCEQVSFNDNVCWHWRDDFNGDEQRATLDLNCLNAIVNSTHFRANRPVPSVNFHGICNAIYNGNIASAGPINFAGIPQPSLDFNRH